MVGIVGRTMAAHQAGAVPEHITGVCHSRSAPIIAHIDGAQIIAAIEHVSHSGHLRRTETAQVKACQTSAAPEHPRHIGYLGRVATAQIQARQL